MARIRIRRNEGVGVSSRYWSVHTHSRYSYNDALPKVADIVARAKELGYRGLGLTDHGNMSGSIELYRECRKAGIKPFPGSELYLVEDRTDKKAKRYHCCVVAYTETGYRNLVHLSTLSHRNFHHKPILDMGDLARLAEEGRTEGLALTTGCYFGMVVQTLVENGYEAARAVVASFASWFDTYVEIQMHCIEQEPMSEVEIARSLYRIAQELDLPVIVTQDSHYVHEEDRPLHESLKSLVSWSDDPDDAIFPGDGFHMADEEWMADHHLVEIYEAGLDGLDRLLGLHTLTIPEADEYHYRVPTRYDNPQKELQVRVVKAATETGLGEKASYFDALMEELEVVRVAGMAGYLLMVAEVCEHMRETGMFYQIRGSAAGSLICFLLGISDVDPLKWKLRFDRFLTKDRTKPPDIDIDIDSERRDELISWLEGNYTVCRIGTFGTYGMEVDEDDEGTGSLLRRYYTRSRRAGGATSWDEVPGEDRRMLRDLSDLELASGYGMHAAGLILTQTAEEMHAKVPMMWSANKGVMVSQYDMHVIEDLGLVKLDVLGVKTLAVIRRTLESLGRDPKEGLGFIPMRQDKVFRTIASGDTAGMFQLEGGTSRRHISRLRPTKIADVIAAMALFRPGVMSSGATDSYISRKRREEAVPEQHPILERITKETFGIMLYQDQVIEVIREIGMDVEGLNAILKALKASNKNVAAAGRTLDRYEQEVRDLCTAKGFSEEDVEILWRAILGFRDYSFNRAHSTVYGITAYRTAWLIVNHPVEYHAALLSVASNDKKKEAYYAKVTRSRGIRLLRPDVQFSGPTYAPSTKGVVRALSSIKGIGKVAATAIAKEQPFKDLDDFAERVNQSKVSGIVGYKKYGKIDTGALELLKDAGALESLGVES